MAVIPLFIADYEEKNVSKQRYDKSAGTKSSMNGGENIILSFFSLFHTFISPLLVLEKERRRCTMEYLVQLGNFFQLKCTFSKPM